MEKALRLTLSHSRTLVCQYNPVWASRLSGSNQLYTTKTCCYHFTSTVLLQKQAHEVQGKALLMLRAKTSVRQTIAHALSQLVVDPVPRLQSINDST